LSLMRLPIPPFALFSRFISYNKNGASCQIFFDAFCGDRLI
jgi:hypothetical protein